MNSEIILGRIIQKLIDKGYAQVSGYNSFGFIELKGSSIRVSREGGEDTPIPFGRIILGIDAYKLDNNLYDNGPAALRSVGITHLNSPIFAFLHLLSKADYS
jgi:hypothetical protein